MTDQHNDFTRADNFTQPTGRCIIDEDSFKYRIDYICKTNPKVFWRCFHNTCPGRVFTEGFTHPIYYINQNHNHLTNIREARAEVKSKYKMVKKPEREYVKKQKNIIYHFKA